MSKTKRRTGANRETASPTKPARPISPKVPAPAPPQILSLADLRDWVWPAATVAFLIIALSTLTKNGTWNDEWIKQYEFTAGNPPYVSTSRDGHPLHFMIGQFWGGIAGVSPFALRFPWALFAAVCIPLAYLLGRLTHNRRLARITCVLMASSSYLLFYAQDANYYAEMLFYSLAAVVCFWTFLETGGMIALILGVFSLALLYLVHPFGAVFGGAVGLGAIVGGIASPVPRRNILKLKTGNGNPAPGIIKAIALSAIVFATLRFHLLSALVSSGKQFLGSFHLGGSYSNTAFNLALIQSALRDYGPNIISKSLLTTLLGWLFLVLAILGFVDLVRRKPWHALMIGLVFAASLVVVFCFKVDRFFHLRYLSFIVPPYLLLVSLGLCRLELWLESHLPNQKFAGLYPAAILLALLAPGYFQQLTFDGGYLKKVGTYFRGRITPEDRVYSYELAPAVPMSPPGVPSSQHVVLPGIVSIGQGLLSNAFFKYSLADHPASYLLHHWNEPRTTNLPLFEWADQWMTRVVYAPSIDEVSSIQYYNRPPEKLPLPIVCAVLHRWDWPDRYVVAPHLFELDLAREESRPRFDLKQERGLLNRLSEDAGRRIIWKSPVLFEHPGAYRFEIVPPASLANPQVELRLNGELIPSSDAGGNLAKVFQANVAAPKNEIEIAVRSTEPAKIETQLPLLRICADLQRGFKIHPFYFHPPDPQAQSILADYDGEGKPRLILKRNYPVAYRIYAPEAGRYRVTLEAIEDRPGPVVVDLALDGNAAGILAFTQANNNWGKRQALLDLSAGLHDLTLTFLSEMDVMAKEPDLDNDFILGGIEIASAKTSDPDDRMKLVGQIVPSAGLSNGLRANFARFETPDKMASGWERAGDAKLAVQPDRAEPGEIAAANPEGRVLEFEVSTKENGARLASPRIVVAPGQYLYFALETRSNLDGKHSANLLIEYLNTAGAQLGSLYARGSDINNRTDWKRYAYFGSVPHDAATARIVIAIYPNSRGITPPSVRFEFRRLRLIDNPPAGATN